MKGHHSFGGALAVGAFLAASVVVGAMALGVTEARPHEWYPPNCCSGFDCRPIEMESVRITPEGFVIPGNPEVVPYTSKKIRQTPPEGQGRYHVCTRGGKSEGAIICLYIPNWGT
ncbi:MAG: hypothetical protein K5872_22125 [Rhizobiaceae bacterium]|nr:hypothetical protein [Rhizobiaceae bacterium]MCV0408918.1 hypothetical protein [Rhizobiaceae bacterium]